MKCANKNGSKCFKKNKNLLSNNNKLLLLQTKINNHNIYEYSNSWNRICRIGIRNLFR